jgi:hypothetical protein
LAFQTVGRPPDKSGNLAVETGQVSEGARNSWD